MKLTPPTALTLISLLAMSTFSPTAHAQSDDIPDVIVTGNITIITPGGATLFYPVRASDHPEDVGVADACRERNGNFAGVRSITLESEYFVPAEEPDTEYFIECSFYRAHGCNPNYGNEVLVPGHYDVNQRYGVLSWECDLGIEVF
ncbi:uncharacterized protein BDV14DRAFT_169402 [Aspergillus stella-maris]|uniref:uncharacterized protein n=1 Tax=Aspergillus stella-maris TaxID=1810926 RepID=UPI003CCD5C7B